MLLKNKTALVYGASGAVGGAVSKAFAREGALVVLAARTESRLAAIVKEIQAERGKAVLAPVDAVDPQAVVEHLDRVARAHGPVHVMFNGVGLDDTQGQALTVMAFERFLAPIVTGMKTWFHTGTAVARHMAANGGGVIVGISANAAREAYTLMGGFGVATGAVEHFLRHLAKETGPQGVRVCCIRSPGSPDAPGVREAFKIHAAERNMTLDEFEAWAAKDVPIRHLSSLAEIADLAVLLASPHARVLTATVINGTGGAQVN